MLCQWEDIYQTGEHDKCERERATVADKMKEQERDVAKKADGKTTAPREMLCQDLREKTSILPVENISI